MRAPGVRTAAPASAGGARTSASVRSGSAGRTASTVRAWRCGGRPATGPGVRATRTGPQPPAARVSPGGPRWGAGARSGPGLRGERRGHGGGGGTAAGGRRGGGACRRGVRMVQGTAPRPGWASWWPPPALTPRPEGTVPQAQEPQRPSRCPVGPPAGASSAGRVVGIGGTGPCTQHAVRDTRVLNSPFILKQRSNSFIILKIVTLSKSKVNQRVVEAREVWACSPCLPSAHGLRRPVLELTPNPWG